MNNKHVRLSAHLCGYDQRGQELALAGYEDAMAGDNSMDQSKLTEKERAAYNHGIWYFETENAQD